jgi:hypothetical protein
MSNIIYDYLSTPIETFLEKVQANFLEYQKQDYSNQINAISDLLTKDKDYATFFKKINLNSEDVVGGRQPISNNFLKSVSIENFKTIKNQTIELNNLNVFIGRNNVGKSNILSFFEFIFKVPLSVNIFAFNLHDISSNPNVQFNEYQLAQGGQNNFLSYGQENADNIQALLHLDNGMEFSFNFISTNQDILNVLQKIVYIPMKHDVAPNILLLIYMCFVVVHYSWMGSTSDPIYRALSRPYQATEIIIKNWQEAVQEFLNISLNLANQHPENSMKLTDWNKLIAALPLILDDKEGITGGGARQIQQVWKLLTCCFYEYPEVKDLTTEEFVECYKFAKLIYKQFFSDLVFGIGNHLSLLPQNVYPKFELPIFHLNNTSKDSPLRIKTLHCKKIADSHYLKEDCENLAVILSLMKIKYQSHYQLLISHIKEVILDFNDFELHTSPWPDLQDEIPLLWTSIHFPDKKLMPKDLSDGSIRFIALATILLMPPELQPAIIVIDEPELGLHPWAIKSLGGILKYAAKYRQIIISTQSPYLLEQVGVNNIVTVDRIGKYTTFKRLNQNELKNWLLDFSITELWEMNIIGANN